MRHTLYSICVGLIAGLLTFAPTTARAQATQPSPTILVLPFTAPSGANDAWIGKAVQQDLLTDLTQGSVARVLAPASAPAAIDQDAALGTARQMGASIVVYGQAQTTGKETRLSGQVLDATDGKPLAAIKATGPIDELFHLEDALAGQVFYALPRNLLNAQTQQGLQNMAAHQGQQPQPGAAQGNNPQQQWPNGPYANPGLNTSNIYGSSQSQAAATEPQPQPQYVTSPPYYDNGTTYNYYTYSQPATPDYGYYYPAYTYGYPGWDYSYPGWGWWPFWGSSFFVFDFDGHHHDHDFDHHDFDHHWNGNSHGGNGTFNHGGVANGNFTHNGVGNIRNGVGNGTNFAHSGFGAGVPRMGGGATAFGPRVPSGGLRSTGRVGGFSGGIRSGGFGGGGFRGGMSGGGFHGASAGGFHGGFGGGMHGGGGGGGHR